MERGEVTGSVSFVAIDHDIDIAQQVLRDRALHEYGFNKVGNILTAGKRTQADKVGDGIFSEYIIQCYQLLFVEG